MAAGHQRLHIGAWHWVVIRTDVPGGRDEYRLEELPGVKCTATNDKGSWETIPPGTVDVAIDGGKLTIECAKAGFKTGRRELGCSSARSRAIYGTLLALPFIALTAVAAPIAVPVAIQAGAQGAAILGVSAGQFIAAPDPDACVYDDQGGFVLQAVDGR